ncbi:MAG: polysaccharide pyruvyl transferase family protein [Deltaproteobacteria bacterium]|nr:polysaccharide pyruvyl transferase family protein [Deltaproteobacteria bacterium]
MNILAIGSKQWHPEHEWILRGTEQVLEQVWNERINWVLYDCNPDLTAFDGYQFSQKNKSVSNSFHPLSSLPFSKIVIAGTAAWCSPSLEPLYGLLLRSNLPIYALGLEIPAAAIHLSPNALACLSRYDTRLTVSTESAKEWLRRYDLEATILPDLSIFASPLQKTDKTNGRPSVGFIMVDSQRPFATIQEENVRVLCRLFEELSGDWDGRVLCPTADDFMRFSTIFPQQTFYHHDAMQWLQYIAQCDVIVTHLASYARMANACGVQTVYLSNEQDERIEDCPAICPSDLSQLKANLAKTQQTALSIHQLEDWKTSTKARWLEFLQTGQNIPKREAA